MSLGRTITSTSMSWWSLDPTENGATDDGVTLRGGPEDRGTRRVFFSIRSLTPHRRSPSLMSIGLRGELQKKVTPELTPFSEVL